jgi:formylglycine-generating enzyme required for sulfatase activity
LPTIITIKGIEESISNLQYRNKSALKYQLVHAIQDFYQDEQSIETLQEINSDELIRRLWQVGDDPLMIKNRRKNLNSIKSTINTDLKKLYQEGKNPDGIIIGPSNIFIMSDEAKEAAFEAFRSGMEKTGAVDLSKMLEVLNIINESLSNVDGIIEKEGSSAAGKLKELQNLIQGLSSKVKLDRNMFDQNPGKLQVFSDQAELELKQEPIPEVPPVEIRRSEDLKPLKELFDYPELEEEPEINGEVLEEALDREEAAELRLDEELENVELAEADLGQLDEMTLEDREDELETFAEEEVVEEHLEVIEEQEEQEGQEEEAEKEEIEVESIVEEILVDDQETETEELELEADADVETEELKTEDEEIEETAFVAEEITEEFVDLTDQETLSAIEDEEGLEEGLEITEAQEGLAEDLEIYEELNEEAPEVDLEGPKAEAQDLSEKILESEEIDAADLPETEELPEDLEPADEQVVEGESAGLENLETVETLSEPEELLEEAVEDVEELDLDAEGVETEITAIPEAIEEELAEETVPIDNSLSKTESVIIEEPEAETEQMLEIEAGEEVVDAEEIIPESVEETAEDEFEEIEVVDAETELAEQSAEEIVEEMEPETALEAEPEESDADYVEADLSNLESLISTEEPAMAPQILPEGLLGVTEANIKVNPERARYLAEEFNDSLAAMDKFHNQYILIPQGPYLLDSRRPQKDAQAERVKELPAFYIGKFPVTNALFEVFIEKTGYKTTAEKKGAGLVYYPRCRQDKDERSGLNSYTYNSALVSEVVRGACWYQPYGPGSTLHRKRNHPVVQVSLEDALAFASWTGKRLSTEEEWEAAARGTKGLIYPWGARWKKGVCNVEESDIGDTAPVEQYIEFANEFGLVDMLGNILEWTMDLGEENGRPYYIVKGGSWISKSGVRLTDHMKMDKETSSNILGFRCVAY